MATLILTDGGSAAGSLKAARIADKVVGMEPELACRPAPAIEDLPGFFRARHDIMLSQSSAHSNGWRGRDSGLAISAVFDQAESCDRFELWFSADAEGQLGLCLALAEVGRRAELAGKSWMLVTDKCIGEQRHEDIRQWAREFLPASSISRLGADAWRAFCADTPLAWRDLLDRDLSGLPHLRAVVPMLLAELPDIATGLTASQRALLIAARSSGKCINVLADVIGYRLSPFGYWRLGELLVQLATGPAPALSGVTATVFDLDLHQDVRRHKEFINAPLQLTPLGEALLAGEADWCSENPVDAWWGGTHLTSDHLWRWDPVGELVGP